MYAFPAGSTRQELLGGRVGDRFPLRLPAVLDAQVREFARVNGIQSANRAIAELLALALLVGPKLVGHG